MIYEIIFNIPNEKEQTKVEISEEQLTRLEGNLNARSIVKIGDSYYNTTYIVKIVPKKERVVINENYLIEGRKERGFTPVMDAELKKIKDKITKFN